MTFSIRPSLTPLQVLERLARFDRVLSQPGGSLLLCGQSGVGRRSCLLLMAYMHLMEFFTPKMTRTYDLKVWSAVGPCHLDHSTCASS